MVRDPVVLDVLDQFRDEANRTRVPMSHLLAAELARTCAVLAEVRAELATMRRVA